MKTLTIDVDEDVLRRAEALASASGTTIKAMIERYVSIVAAPSPEPAALPPNLRSVMGMLPPMSDEERARAIDEYRTQKYGGK